VLARARLPDSDRLRSGRDAATALDFNQQAEASGIPEERERLIGHDDDRYR